MSDIEEDDVPLRLGVGRAICVLDRDRILYEKYEGHRKHSPGDLTHDVTRETIFMIASISKIITALTALHAFEQFLAPKGLHLNSDISHYVPFQIGSPRPLRLSLLSLMTHTSGIRDNSEAIDDAYTHGADDPMSLYDFLKSYLCSEGPKSDGWYSKEQNFHEFATHDYSNIGYQLLGYIVEQITEMGFAEYSYKYVLDPIGIKRSGEFCGIWRLMDFEGDWRDVHAYPNGSNEPFSWPGYPDGGFRCTGPALAKIVQVILRRGVCDDGSRVLTESTIGEMLSTKHILSSPTGYGISLRLLEDKYKNWILESHEKEDPERQRIEELFEYLVYSHEGGETGVQTSLVFLPGRYNPTAAFVLVNEGWPEEPATGATGDAIIHLARHYNIIPEDLDDLCIPIKRCASANCSPTKSPRHSRFTNQIMRSFSL